MRWAVVGLLVAAVAMTGCLEDVGLGGNAEDGWEMVTDGAVVTFSMTDSFDPENPPSEEEDTYEQGTVEFDVPEDAAGVTFTYSVQFDDRSPAEGEVQELSLRLEDPDGEEHESLVVADDVEDAISVEEPLAGTWTFHHETRGEGVLHLSLFAMAPSGR